MKASTKVEPPPAADPTPPPDPPTPPAPAPAPAPGPIDTPDFGKLVNLVKLAERRLYKAAKNLTYAEEFLLHQTQRLEDYLASKKHP